MYSNLIITYNSFTKLNIKIIFNSISEIVKLLIIRDYKL